MSVCVRFDQTKVALYAEKHVKARGAGIRKAWALKVLHNNVNHWDTGNSSGWTRMSEIKTVHFSRKYKWIPGENFAKMRKYIMS